MVRPGRRWQLADAAGDERTCDVFLAAETEQATRTLFMAPEWFGIIAIVAFAGLLGLTYAFKNVSKKH